MIELHRANVSPWLFPVVFIDGYRPSRDIQPFGAVFSTLLLRCGLVPAVKRANRITYFWLGRGPGPIISAAPLQPSFHSGRIHRLYPISHMSREGQHRSPHEISFQVCNHPVKTAHAGQHCPILASQQASMVHDSMT